MRYIVLASFALWAIGTVAGNLPMPPRFTPEGDPEQVLGSYPLGFITELAAHSHHGHPDHKIDLPNGLEGWVYEVYGDKKATTYVQPGGAERIVREIDPESPHWAYTLVFGQTGKVVDVLYDGKHPRLGLSALQVQRRGHPVAQKLPGVEHGPHFAPGASQERY